MMKEKNSILVIEDDAKLREVLKKILDKKGFVVEVSATGSDAIERIEERLFDIALTDLKMPGMGGMDVLKAVKRISPQTYVIIMTAFGTIDSAVEAMKNGAFDYVTKPFRTEEILVVINKVLEHRYLRKKVEYLTKKAEEKHRFEDIVGKSGAMQAVFEMIKRVSGTDTTVLITGETGTGKELVARAIHNNSERKSKSFVVVNSSAIPENLLESELFGHVKGAFTGALRDKRGLFQEAHQGTLFLDEIGEVPPSTQVKLLRAIEDKFITPVGAVRGERVDLRLLTATNHNLQEQVDRGSFRGDLYYRLKVMSIHLPRLTERKEDILLLANHFLDKYSNPLAREAKEISKEVMSLFLEYHWPGNVRELEHAVESAVVVCDSHTIDPAHLPPEIQFPEETHIRRAGDEGRSLEEVEKTYISLILKKAGGQKKKAASILGIDRRTLYRKLKTYGIE
jgi:DNA-binding NtrC family response regulator